MTDAEGHTGAGSQAGATPERKRRGRVSLAGERVLVAEDNLINQRLLHSWLAPTGAAIEVVETGTQAMDRIRQKPFTFYLLDIHMPDGDGIDLCRFIRTGQPRVPVFAITADALASRRDQAMAAGFTDYLVKPVDYPALLQRMRACLDEARPGPHAEPGIDIARALRAHNDDAALLRQLAGLFQALYADACPRLRGLLETGATDDARALVHDIRGVAGSFGADRLQQTAAELERALAAPGPPEAAVWQRLEAFGAALAPVVEDVRALAAGSAAAAHHGG
jgi:CheY-like chemotaxis protein